MSYFLALAVFLTADGPVETQIGPRVFPGADACQQFLVMVTPHLDTARVRLETRHRREVRYITFCHAIGGEA